MPIQVTYPQFHTAGRTTLYLWDMSQVGKGGTVYILTSVSKRVVYTGVTSDLMKRIWQHKDKYYPGSFTSRYGCCILVYYQHFENIVDAIAEEKRIKGGNRRAKEKLIEV